VQAGADVARRGQRKAAGARRATGPLATSQLQAEAASSHRQRIGCATFLHVRRQARSGAPRRAFKNVGRVLTTQNRQRQNRQRPATSDTLCWVRRDNCPRANAFHSLSASRQLRVFYTDTGPATPGLVTQPLCSPYSVRTMRLQCLTPGRLRLLFSERPLTYKDRIEAEGRTLSCCLRSEHDSTSQRCNSICLN
jgi:hypothetical protein